MDKQAKITNILNAYRSGHRIPGMAAGIILNGELFYIRGFGSTNMKNYQLFNADTIFALQDITTLFTAQSILHLYQQSDFSLDLPLQTYLHDLDTPGQTKLTSRHILNHETGFDGRLPIVSLLDNEKRSWLQDVPSFPGIFGEIQEHFDLSAIRTRSDLISIFKKLPYTYAPGQHTQYNLEPFMLAAILLEKVSKVSWETYVDFHIFQPLALRRTGIHPGSDTENRTHYYVNTIDQPIEVPAPYNPLGAPIASIFSTVNDLIVFLQHSLDQSRNNRSTPHSDCDTSAYRCGWQVEHTNGKCIWSLAGNQLGGSSYIEMIPDASYGFVMFANMDMLRLPSLSKRIRDLLFQ